MSSFSQIRTALRDTIVAAIPELHGYDRIPEDAHLPAVIVEPDTGDFHVSMSMDTTWMFSVVVLVSRVDSERGQDALDQYIDGYGPKSIRQVLFNNASLGLPDTDACACVMNNYGGSHKAGGIDHIGAAIKVSVTTGTA